MKNNPRKSTGRYLILLGASLGVLLLVILGITILDMIDKGHLIKDNIAGVIVFFICIPGIIIGSTGSIINTIRKNSNHNF
jgi:hypothetical protein